VVSRDDVARRAGVSTAVVSYVVNNGPRRVAPATRERVLRAIAELGYRPNSVARSLRTKRTRTIGLIVPDIADSFFAQLAREVQTKAHDRGFTLLVANAMDDAASELEHVKVFIERRVDGIVLASTGLARHGFDELAESGIASVMVDRELPGVRSSSVVVDNHHGGYIATRHLLEHGHTRVGCIGGPLEITIAADRSRGWRQALLEAGVEPDPSLEIHSSFSRLSAYRGTLRLLRSRRPPTAIFACADEQALGVYRAAATVGARIPEDLAVVSFDSAATAPYLTPGLTAIRQPVALLAERAVGCILDQLENPGRPMTRDCLPIELVVRGSCGCPDTGPDTDYDARSASDAGPASDPGTPRRRRDLSPRRDQTRRLESGRKPQRRKPER
jgi:LacI family transcriptional regulator